MSTENNCPKCNSKNLQFDTFCMEDADVGKFDATCNDCGFEGRQWYTLCFAEWEELKEDGQYEIIL